MKRNSGLDRRIKQYTDFDIDDDEQEMMREMFEDEGF